MLAGVPVADVISDMGDSGTRPQELIRWLRGRGYVTDSRALRFVGYSPNVDPRPRLPKRALVRVDHGIARVSTHWLLWADGRFWDPAALTSDQRESLLSLGNGRIYSIIQIF